VNTLHKGDDDDDDDDNDDDNLMFVEACRICVKHIEIRD
jgi:hypothetical protein